MRDERANLSKAASVRGVWAGGAPSDAGAAGVRRTRHCVGGDCGDVVWRESEIVVCGERSGAAGCGRAHVLFYLCV